MNNTFEYKRFAKVLRYDLIRSYHNFGISLLMFIFMPLLLSVLGGSLAMVFNGTWIQPGINSRIATFIITLIGMMFTFAPKVFGQITEKKYGSEQLMIPASSFEKYLSMALYSAVIVPFIFIFCNLAVDAAVVSLNLASGETLLSFFNRYSVINESGIYLNLRAILCFSLVIDSLVFLLGSIYFQRFKIAKTILSLIALQILFSMILIPLIKWFTGTSGLLNIDSEDLLRWFDTHVDNVELYMNLLIDFSIAVKLIVVNALIYLRIRTLKH